MGSENNYAHDGHVDWLRANYDIKPSKLGIEVANVLGLVGCGLYNAPINHKKIDWKNERMIDVVWGQDLSNWDFCNLSVLLVECHRRMLRVTIMPCNFNYLKLRFFLREKRHGARHEIIPELREIEKMVNDWRLVNNVPIS